MVRASRGTSLLLILLLAGLAVQFGRSAFLSREGPPAFCVEKPSGILVSLGSGFPHPGVHQFSDGTTLLGVIQMTHLMATPELAKSKEALRPLQSGETLVLFRTGAKVFKVERRWMPARQRMVLGIPLRPDRMGLQDWQALPGVGPRMAWRIETNRQQNGDFGSLEGLKRVRGIGPKHIKAWKKFFRQEVRSNNALN